MSQCKPFVLSGDQWTDLVITGLIRKNGIDMLAIDYIIL